MYCGLFTHMRYALEEKPILLELGLALGTANDSN